MTSSELLDSFALHLDKYGSPNFSEAEALVFLNHAQLERLKRLLPDDQGGMVNLDMDANTLMNVRPLIYPVSATMNGSGVVTFAAINTALQTASGDAGCKVHRILGLTWTVDNVSAPIKYTRTNVWDSYKRNVFKAGSASAPRYKVDATNLTFAPVNASAALSVTCLKTPKILTADNTPDFDDYNLGLVLQIALQLASQSIRDQELLQTIQNSNVAK